MTVAAAAASAKSVPAIALRRTSEANVSISTVPGSVLRDATSMTWLPQLRVLPVRSHRVRYTHVITVKPLTIVRMVSSFAIEVTSYMLKRNPKRIRTTGCAALVQLEI